MTNQIKLPSVSAIQKWAEHQEVEKVSNTCVAVWKNELWNYFTKQEDSYVLVMTSVELLGENR